jgi:predicted DNA-binding transcriptional regulator YafY
MDKRALNVSASIAALGVLGVVIETLPGEYRVNYREGKAETAQFTEDLAEAIETGARMVAERPEPPPKTYARRGITKRAFVRRHNRQWRAKFHRQKAKEYADAQRRALASRSFPEDC